MIEILTILSCKIFQTVITPIWAGGFWIVRKNGKINLTAILYPDKIENVYMKLFS